MKVDFRQPTEDDIIHLAQNLSVEDRREVLAQGYDILWAVNHSVQGACECVSILVNDELVCLTGLIPPKGLDIEAYPWLLGTEKMQRYPKQVLKHSRFLITRWLDLHPELTNFVDARHHRAIAWLTHLGASFEFLPAYGLYRRPFYQFTFRR